MFQNSKFLSTFLIQKPKYIDPSKIIIKNKIKIVAKYRIFGDNF